MKILEALKYLFLGIIQGITEVLPVSSSGHVEIFQTIFGLEVDHGLLFLILVNTGSLVTFLFLYFNRIVELIRDFFLYIFKKELREAKYKNFMFSIRIIVAIIPAALVGFLLEDQIDSILESSYSLLLVGSGLLLTGTMLYWIKDVRILKGKTMINWVDTILIGMAQAVSIFPGVSRSGMTSSTSIKRGMGIDSALNFSFLMYIPLSLGALLLKVYKIIKNATTSGMTFYESVGIPDASYFFYYFLAFIGAMVATYIAYRLIFNIFKSGKLKYFSYYCFAIGIASIMYYMVAYAN